MTRSWWLRALLVGALGAGCAAYPVPVPPPAPLRAVRPPPPPPEDLFVVVPDPDGTSGAITVTHGATQHVLEGAYTSARIAERTVEVGRLTEQEVQEAFRHAREALPATPVVLTVFFKFDRDELTDESQDALRRVFDEIARRPAPEVIVIGHTDRRGTVPYNDALSLQRAARVRSILVAAGVPEGRIQIAGRGEREPVVPTEDEVAEPRNRRVEITVR